MMRSSLRYVIVVVFASACASASGRAPADDAPSNDRQVLVDFAARLFADVYAPLEYKREHRKWDAEASVDRLRTLATPEYDEAAFQRGLHVLFRSPADIHTSIDFKKSNAVWLGFAMRRTTTGHRIAWVDPTLGQIADALPIGAKVLAFDGVPVERVVDRAATQTGWDATPRFRERFADWFAVLRAEREWAVLPETNAQLTLTIETNAGPQSVVLRWRSVSDSPNAVTRCLHWGKSKTSYLGDFGRVIWRSDSEAVPAYVFEVEGGTFGYIRLGNYGAGGAEAMQRIADFDRAIDAFIEQKVRGIILDQLGNGGGNYVFGLTMLSRLAAEPLVAPTQRFQIDPRGALAAFPDPDVLRPFVEALDPVDDAAGVARAFETHPLLSSALAYLPRDPATFEELRTFLRFVVSPHAPPRSRTAPQYQVVRSYRFDEARGARYLGPIVVLIDELNFSAAEYVAAAFADHASGPRAVLFGATTSGAGGDQRWYRDNQLCGGPSDGMTPCISSEVQQAMRAHEVAGIAMTVTLGYRLQPDGQIGAPIENVGVAPHRSYVLTKGDLEQNFAPMKAAIVDTLTSAER